MNTKVFLHIGLEKTGSTYMQSLLRANVRLLKSNNICYPSSLFLRPNHIEICSAFAQTEDLGFLRRVRNRKKFKLKLRNYLCENKDKNIVISNEHLSSRVLRIEDIESLVSTLACAGHELVVIIYVRNHRDWLVSLYSENVKSGFCGSLDQFLTQAATVMTWASVQNGALDIISRWRHVCAVSSVNIYSYEQANKIGLHRHFFDHALSLTNSSSSTVPENIANASLRAWHLKVLLQVNSVLGYSVLGFYSRKLLRYFLSKMQFGKTLQKDELSHSVLDTVAKERDDELNNYLATSSS